MVVVPCADTMPPSTCLGIPRVATVLEASSRKPDGSSIDTILQKSTYDNKIMEHPKFGNPSDVGLLGGGAVDLITAEGGPRDPLWKILRIAPRFHCPGCQAKRIPRHKKTWRSTCGGAASKGASNRCGDEQCRHVCNHRHNCRVGLSSRHGRSQVSGDIGLEPICPDNCSGERTLGQTVFRPLVRLAWRQEVQGGAAAVAHFHTAVDTIYQQVLKRKDELKEGDTIAGHLLRMRGPDGQPLPPQLIKAQIATIFWAGHDTTGNTIAWTLFAIARYPEIEARIMAELDGLGLLATPIEPQPREMRLDDLSRLPYLDAVIKESMRYYMVVPGVSLRINPDEDVVLSSGLVIPRNTTVFPFVGGPIYEPLGFSSPRQVRSREVAGAQRGIYQSGIP
eukprot:jgi/Botrbrau1/17784/Bobra.0127s0037.2